MWTPYNPFQIGFLFACFARSNVLPVHFNRLYLSWYLCVIGKIGLDKEKKNYSNYLVNYHNVDTYLFARKDFVIRKLVKIENIQTISTFSIFLRSRFQTQKNKDSNFTMINIMKYACNTVVHLCFVDASPVELSIAGSDLFSFLKCTILAVRTLFVVTLDRFREWSV